jgi:sulfate adenylyltransferase subunit 1 (EFTu-like GTPase family)
MKLFVLLAAVVSVVSCCQQIPAEISPQDAAFEFEVVEAYYHAKPEPNVVAAGTVVKGTVRVGDKIIVRHDGEEDVVEVIGLLGEDQKLEEASEGQGAGLRLKVASEDQYQRWDDMQIVGPSGK